MVETSAIAREEPASAIELAARALATVRELAEQIASAAGISRVAVAETGMPSGEALGDSADRTRAAAAVVVLPASDPVAVEAAAGAAVGAGKRLDCRKIITGARL